jgi:hypothetical protein
MLESDTSVFVEIAATSSAPVTAFIARHELRAAFTRREGEGAFKTGEADRLYNEFLEDVSQGDLCEIPLSGTL